MTPYDVEFTPSAQEDLERLIDHLLDAAQSLEDMLRAQQTIARLRSHVELGLRHTPWAYRKAGDGRRPTLREFVISLGATGYVVLYEIDALHCVRVLALRHQREDDYH